MTPVLLPVRYHVLCSLPGSAQVLSQPKHASKNRPFFSQCHLLAQPEHGVIRSLEAHDPHRQTGTSEVRHTRCMCSKECQPVVYSCGPSSRQSCGTPAAGLNQPTRLIPDGVADAGARYFIRSWIFARAVRVPSSHGGLLWHRWRPETKRASLRLLHSLFARCARSWPRAAYESDVQWCLPQRETPHLSV